MDADGQRQQIRGQRKDNGVPDRQTQKVKSSNEERMH